MRRGNWALILLGLLLAACSASKPRADISYDASGFTTPDSPFIVTASDSYRIGPMDVLRITVFEVPQLSGDFEVNALGSIEMPLVGAVEAQNLTPVEFRERVKGALTKKYFQDPSVSVEVKEVRSQRVTIDGSIAAPGVYPVSGNLSLLQAVAMAKGLESDANPGRVVVFRTIQGRRAAAAFDLNKVREGITPDPQIYGNDVIVVDGSRSRAALRDIVRTLPLLALFRFF